MFGRAGCEINQLGFILKRSADSVNVPDGTIFPEYIGRGYHLIKGNPESESSIDPGYRKPVLKLEYKKNTKTGNGKFLIPDRTTSQLKTSCTLKPS